MASLIIKMNKKSKKRKKEWHLHKAKKKKLLRILLSSEVVDRLKVARIPMFGLGVYLV